MSSKPPKLPRFKSNRRLITWLVAGVFFMFGFSYLMVPIFTFVCKQAGINGKGALTASTQPSDQPIDLSRTIKIELAASMHGNFPFKFGPLEHYVYVHPGERKLIYFYAENLTGQAKTIQAVPSITPADGARFFKKIECFCFTQQDFAVGEKAKMFVNFYIDPSVPKSVNEITLAYTVFDASQYAKKGSHTSKGRVPL